MMLPVRQWVGVVLRRGGRRTGGGLGPRSKCEAGAQQLVVVRVEDHQGGVLHADADPVTGEDFGGQHLAVARETMHRGERSGRF